jgi:type I restriction enzyme S subunit
VSAISKSILYGVSESAKACGKYRLLRITDIQNNNVQWNNVPYTDFDSNKAESYLLNDGDILFARTGATVGKSYLVQGLTEKAIYASYLIRVQTYDAVLPQYVKFYFESGYYWEQIEQESVGVGQPNVNGSILGNLQIPIPPIHEQNRIVLELTRWMDIIDAIEDGTIELESYVKQTKSKILDLAISGKLVPQDPNDEPAIALLKRINPGFMPCDNSHYENLPQGWVKAGFKDIYQTISSRDYQIQQRDIINEGLYPVVSQSSNYIEGYYNNKENLLDVTAPVLIFGDHTRVVKYIDFPFVIGADGVKVIKPLVNDKFAYYLLLYTSQHIENKGYSRHFQLIAKANYCIPPLREQTHIVKTIETLFETINTITAEL